MNDELRIAMAGLDAAVRDRDAARAAMVLDAEFAQVVCLPQPAVVDREHWLRTLGGTSPLSVTRFRQIDVTGTCAAVLSQVEQDGGSVVYSDVWRHRSQGWRLWRRHATPAATPQPSA